MSRLIKFVSDSFKFSFMSKEAQFLERNILKLNKKLINKQKRRRYKSIKNSNNLFTNVCRNYFATSNQ